MKINLTALKEKYTVKVMHVCYERKINNDTQIEKHLRKNKFAVYCIIGDCSHIYARYYFPLRHNEVAKTLLNSHFKKFYPSRNIHFHQNLNIYTKKAHVNTGGIYH